MVSTDVLVEDQDFRKDADPRRLGRKTVNVNLSDLAAMGARPALRPPRARPAEEHETRPGSTRSPSGVKEAAPEHGVAVVGGDLSASDRLRRGHGDGPRARGAVLTRAGASRATRSSSPERSAPRPRASASSRRATGSSAERVALDPKGRRVSRASRRRGRAAHPPPDRPAADAGARRDARRRGHSPRPRSTSRTASRATSTASAAPPASGPRSTRRSCPVDSALADLGPLAGLDPLAAALFGGEDFGLLFTVPQKKLAAVERLAGRFALRRIGTIDDGAGVTARARRAAGAPARTPASTTLAGKRGFKARFLHMLGRDYPPEIVAASFALGVTISFTPLIGLHWIIALLLAFVLKLNKVDVLLGTLVVNPLTIAPSAPSRSRSGGSSSGAARGDRAPAVARDLPPLVLVGRRPAMRAVGLQWRSGCSCSRSSPGR